MSRKALEMEHLSPYSGSVRGSWRNGSGVDGPDRHTGRLWKGSTSFIVGRKGNIRHLARGGSGSMFNGIGQCFSTSGPRPGTGPWHQLYRAARGSPGICHFSYLSSFHE